MKILYAGSPEAARLTLEKLYDSQEKLGFEIVSKRDRYYKNGDACYFMEYKK